LLLSNTFSAAFSSFVCVLHRSETFGTKHSLVADGRQNNLSIQGTDTQWPGRVTGSKVQTQFHLCFLLHYGDSIRD